MTLCRGLALIAALVAVPVGHAAAQFGGMPGMPGSPGGMPGSSPGFGSPQAPPPHCQQLLTFRDETKARGEAIQAASQRKVKPSAKEVCGLFKAFLTAETKMLKAFDENGQKCGVPPQIPQQMKQQHAQAQQVATKVCDAAAQGDRPAGPSLSDALGMTPAVPDSTSKKGAGMFDTLSGSALSR